MSNSNRSSNPLQHRSWAVLLPVLLLAPLSMAPKGCEPVVIGDDCPDETTCTSGLGGQPAANAGAAGSKPGGSAGSAGSQPTGNGGSPGESLCGGQLGLKCAATEYCAFDAKAACGTGDQTGVCTPRPQICPDIYAPVCACDGQTYSNECEAAGKGSSVLYTGVCQEPSSGNVCGGLKPASCAKSEYCNFPIETKCGSGDQTGLCTRIPDACDAVSDPVCGCDNLTYSSACAASEKGISVLHTGSCEGATPGSVCGGLKGTTCDKGEFCDFPIDTKCGSGDQTGSCTPIPSVCTKELAPVCGCDSNTYGNACAAAAAGISVAAKGECPPSGTPCGGKLGATCAANQYCDYPPSAICGKADATGTCADKVEGGCTANYDPVCGCDGQTYGNACEARRAAVSVAADGACP
ncbi:MAG TPA: Kazal-type serine protease inhibitor domain-containing protein [Polyangiaceae bacterium]